MGQPVAEKEDALEASRLEASGFPVVEVGDVEGVSQWRNFQHLPDWPDAGHAISEHDYTDWT